MLENPVLSENVFLEQAWRIHKIYRAFSDVSLLTTSSLSSSSCAKSLRGLKGVHQNIARTNHRQFSTFYFVFTEKRRLFEYSVPFKRKSVLESLFLVVTTKFNVTPEGSVHTNFISRTSTYRYYRAP